MQVECLVCKMSKELTVKELGIVAQIVSIRPKAVDTDYLNAVTFILGNTCKDNAEHTLDFSKDFDAAIEKIIAQQRTYEENLKINVEEDEKLRQKIIEIGEQMKKLADSRIDAIDKRNLLIDLRPSAESDVEWGKKQLIGLTGTDNVEMWS